jgi:hypothetical protein
MPQDFTGFGGFQGISGDFAGSLGILRDFGGYEGIYLRDCLR